VESGRAAKSLPPANISLFCFAVLPTAAASGALISPQPRMSVLAAIPLSTALSLIPSCNTTQNSATLNIVYSNRARAVASTDTQINYYDVNGYKVTMAILYVDAVFFGRPWATNSIPSPQDRPHGPPRAPRCGKATLHGASAHTASAKVELFAHRGACASWPELPSALRPGHCRWSGLLGAGPGMYPRRRARRTAEKTSSRPRTSPGLNLLHDVRPKPSKAGLKRLVREDFRWPNSDTARHRALPAPAGNTAITACSRSQPGGSSSSWPQNPLTRNASSAGPRDQKLTYFASHRLRMEDRFLQSLATTPIPARRPGIQSFEIANLNTCAPAADPRTR